MVKSTWKASVVHVSYPNLGRLFQIPDRRKCLLWRRSYLKLLAASILHCKQRWLGLRKDLNSSDLPKHKEPTLSFHSRTLLDIVPRRAVAFRNCHPQPSQDHLKTWSMFLLSCQCCAPGTKWLMNEIDSFTDSSHLPHDSQRESECDVSI